MKTWPSALVIFALVGASLAGCDSGPKLYPVTGKVTFADGSIPQGEVAVVRFEPVAGSGGPATAKAAAGDIQKDGSFSLTTIQPGDGAFAGEYKVVFSVFKTYLGQESLIDPKYTSAATTPFSATIKPGSTGPLEFVLDPIQP